MSAVRFILGRAGTGKTTHVVEQIAALCRADPLGPPIYWLLPKQATFQAERLLTVRLDGFARVHVVDFGKLGQAVLDSCGDVGMPEVTPAGRRMVIGHLLRQNQKRLSYYGHSAHRAGLTQELDATFAEFERASLDPEHLRRLIDTLDPADDPAADSLRQKLNDVHLLLSSYTAFIGTDRLDPARRLDLVLRRVNQCKALRDATLFVDDFYDFTAYERRLLSAVAGIVGRTEVAMLLDPDDPATADLAVFHRPQRAYRALLKAMGELPVEPPLILRGTRGRTPELAELERALFSGRGPACPSGAPSIDLFEAPDVRAEVDAVARQIRAAVADGTRFRDVAVLVRSLADYREVVHASFAEHGIPWFADHRRLAGHHPVLQMIRGCLLVVRKRWPHDATMMLSKSGLVGLSDGEADALENYVLRHRLRGRAAWESPEPWTFTTGLTRPADDVEPATPSPEDLEAIRQRLVKPLSPLFDVSRNASATVRDTAAGLFEVLDRFGVRDALARWMADAEAAGDAERRGEHEQVWAELVGLLEQMVDVLGDERVTVGEFLDVLDGGLEGFDLAIAPATVDQVLLGEVDRTRAPDVQRVFVLGLAEGMFPRVEQDPLVLSDAERRTLRNRQVDLDEGTERQLLDERFLAYVAFSRPTQQLVVSRPLADEKGRALNPSLFWHELRRLCPGATPRHIARSSAADPRTIGTPRQLIDALMRWVSTGSPAGDPVLSPLYQWLGSGVTEGSAIHLLRARAWPALSYRNDATLDPSRAAELFPSPLSATVRQLEDANACPFRHFARYGLKLRAREADAVTGLDLHNAYHQVMENLTRDLLSKSTDWTQLNAAEARELIRGHAAEVGRQLRGELMLSSARNRYLLDHIERTLERAVASLAEVSRRGKYRPAHVNLRFGGSGAPLPHHTIGTPRHREVHLHGRIDRVDLNDRGTAFTVSDYKLAPASLSLDRVYHGLSLQLLTYLLVVKAGGPALAGRAISPAAAFLLGLLSSHKSVLHPSQGLSPDDPDFHLRTKPRGLIDERAVDSLDGGGETGASKVVAAYRKKEGGLGNRHSTDVATAQEFAGLTNLVERRLGEAADRVVDGDVRVRPYMLGRATPCPQCEYRAVCRFEPGLNPYRVLQPLGRLEVLQRVLDEAGPPDA